MTERKFKAPEGASSITINGETYTVNKKGVVVAPEELHADMLSHGFAPQDGHADPSDTPPPPPPAPADAAALAAAAALEGGK